VVLAFSKEEGARSVGIRVDKSRVIVSISFAIMVVITPSELIAIVATEDIVLVTGATIPFIVPP
jgi:hypothetical protein